MKVFEKKAEVPKVIFAGPPNSGKTTLFNLMSGQSAKTVNYPGSTVEFNKGYFERAGGEKVLLVDIPGIVSLNAVSLDEEVAVEEIFNINEKSPHIILSVVDASHFSRHMLPALQLIDAGFEVIIVLTMDDILRSRGYESDEKKLSELTGCKTVKIKNSLKDINTLRGEVENSLAKSKLPEAKPGKKRFTPGEIKASYTLAEELEKKVIKKTEPDAPVKKKKENSLTRSLDSLFLHRFWGFIFFLLIMSFSFASVFWFASPAMDLVDNLFSGLAGMVRDSFGSSIATDLLADGIIGGSGAVLIFVPQIFVLFIILGILEDSGYLARGAAIIDKPLSMIGLNGRSFVPMLSGFACAIPAIMASRTIPNKKERLLTIFILPLMTCSARLPVFVLLIAFLFPAGDTYIKGLALSAIYLTGIIGSFIISAISSRIAGKYMKIEKSSFILELPVYRKPGMKYILKNSGRSTWAYIRKAGPLIIIFSMIIWFLTNFPRTDDGLNPVPYDESYAADIGHIIEPVMEPAGLDWRVGVALVSSVAAREIFVSSLAVMFNVSEENEKDLLMNMKNARLKDGSPLFTTATIAGLIIFFLFALQCISTVAVAWRETGSIMFAFSQVVIFTGLALGMMIATVQLLRLAGIN